MPIIGTATAVNPPQPTRNITRCQAGKRRRHRPFAASFGSDAKPCVMAGYDLTVRWRRRRAFIATFPGGFASAGAAKAKPCVMVGEYLTAQCRQRRVFIMTFPCAFASAGAAKVRPDSAMRSKLKHVAPAGRLLAPTGRTTQAKA